MGVVVAAVLRQLVVLAGLDRSLLMAPLVYAGLAVGAALATWLLVFGQ